jgi:predicted ester cyclase
METRTVQQDVFSPATPHEVYETLIDQDKHAAMTGQPAKIARKAGGAFSVFDGAITGTTRKLSADKKIVQDWRSDDWPAAHYSKVAFTLAPIWQGRGTHLQLVHSKVPADKAEEISDGWRTYYWEPMAEFFREAKIAPVRRFLEEFKNRENIDVVDETWTKDCVLHVPGFSLPPGRKAQKDIGRAIFKAFGSVHVDVEDTIVEGDRVVERHSATAVHKGEFMGIPATGRKVFWTENHICRIKDGKIAETWSEVSFHDLLRQISSS